MKKNDETALQDLKNHFEDLRDIQKIIVDNSKSRAVAYCLLDAAFFEVVIIEEFIKELGGAGFTSIEDTANFIWELANKE